jgi:hypothetical protein
MFTDGSAQAERWNGTHWSTIAATDSAVPYASFAGVTCMGTSCLAVGRSQMSGSGVKTLVERWNGTARSILGSQSPATPATLNAVACASTTFFAVGSYGTSNTKKTLIERGS